MNKGKPIIRSIPCILAKRNLNRETDEIDSVNVYTIKITQKKDTTNRSI